MRVRPIPAALAALAVAMPLVSGLGSSGALAADCHPFTTTPTFADGVPTPEEVLGFELGNRDVTVAESDAYLAAVDEASSAVSTATLATSHQGRDLRYALVGPADQVETAKHAAETLRDPATPKSVADEIAASAPAILWVAGNVHGGEESGTDASLRVLYELAARTDCAAATIQDNAVVAILPTQNPDGREADTRRNAYGFDMNRDWFARTQPETDGKLEALREYPPVLFIDAHEMGSKTYFFPPNADPVYHEITDESMDWINNTYGASMQQEFDRQEIPYFNYSIYDMFYMGYGDTVPTTGFLGAGMTFEKDSYASTKKRVYEQYVAIWTSLSAAGADKAGILSGWADAHRTAFQQGQAGTLEPNELVASEGDPPYAVPDLTIRHYFLRTDDPDKAREVQSLVRRLQRMDVEVNVLEEDLAVPDYRRYGRAAGPATLPAGTYWIPMAQAQKHWVQAMLHEDTYTPFAYFYDVTAWSQPLLFNVDGGWSGAELSPVASLASPLDEPAVQLPSTAADTVVGVWQMSTGTSAVESSGWLRWLLEKKWVLGYPELATKDIKAGGLEAVDVLVVPDGSASDGEKTLGGAGVREIQDWAAAGGRFVGLSGGAALAGRLGLTTASLSPPSSDIPGSLVRGAVDTVSPLADGVGNEVWSFVEYDPVLEATDPGTVAVSYPETEPDFFVSGYADGQDELKGTAAVTDEAYQEGRVVLFASDPNFRAFTDGTQKILFNALVGPGPAEPAVGTAAARSAAVSAAQDVTDLGGALLVSVRPAVADRAQRLLATYGLTASRTRSGDGVRLTVAGFGSSDRNPVARDLARDLRRLGDDLTAVRFP